MSSPLNPQPAESPLPPEKFFLGAAVVLLVFSILSAGSVGESELLLAIYGGASARFAVFWRGVTMTGDNRVLIAVALVGAILLALRKRYSSAVWLTGGWVMATASVELLKWLVDRDRPPVPFLTEASRGSFPSGHAAESLFVYVYLCLLLSASSSRGIVSAIKDLALVVLAALPIFIGVSRLYLGVHWPSDILGGWAIGSFVLGLSCLNLPSSGQSRPVPSRDGSVASPSTSFLQK